MSERSILHAVKLDCSVCNAKNASFEICYEIKSFTMPHSWEVMGLCGVCKEPALIRLIDRAAMSGVSSPVQPGSWSRSNALDSRFSVIGQHPTPAPNDIPAGLPENVGRPLQEANECLTSGHYSAAGSCYRKTMERALKCIDPEINGMLNARIRQIEKKLALPRHLIELLDLVRLFGNEAMHEDEIDPTKDDCIAAKEFCDLFLTYAFSLPTKIEKAKAKASN